MLRFKSVTKKDYLQSVLIEDYARRSLRSQKELLEFLTQPKIIQEIQQFSGYKVIGLDTSLPLEKNLWKKTDFFQESLRYSEWEKCSVEYQKRLSEGSLKDWRAGGWIWVPEENCWCTPIYLMGSHPVTGNWEIASMRLNPCILTLWHWDHPIEQDALHELKEQDLWFFLEHMGRNCAKELFEGVAQYHRVSKDLQQRFEVWQERKMLQDLTKESLNSPAASVRYL